MVNQRSLTILGATGSVGKSTLDLVRERPDRFKIKGLTAHTNFEFLARLALEFRPDSVVIADETYYKQLKDCLSGTDIVVDAGEDALLALAAVPVDCIVGAIVGIAGLGSVYSAIQAGQKIALANKEREIPEYLQVDEKNKKVKFVRVPKFEEVPYPVNMEPNLVIEYYSR